jgi:hypothetical protein
MEHPSRVPPPSAFAGYFQACERGDSIAERQPLLDAWRAEQAASADRAPDPRDAELDRLRREVADLRRQLGLSAAPR